MHRDISDSLVTSCGIPRVSDVSVGCGITSNAPSRCNLSLQVQYTGADSIWYSITFLQRWICNKRNKFGESFHQGRPLCWNISFILRTGAKGCFLDGFSRMDNRSVLHGGLLPSATFLPAMLGPCKSEKLERRKGCDEMIWIVLRYCLNILISPLYPRYLTRTLWCR